MANIISFPYDSQATQIDSRGLPIYDRAIDSKTFRILFKKWFTTGVFPNPSTNFKVVENATHGVIVKKGYALIDGVMAEMTEDLVLPIEKAETERIDRIVLRSDSNVSVRKTDIVVLKGTGKPSAIIRDSSIYDLVLAEVKVKPNATTITDADITDTRFKTDLCGVVTSTIKGIDTTFVYNQVQSDLKHFKEVEQKEILDWFETAKGALSGDVAGNLLNMITDANKRIDKTIEDISKVNEAIDGISPNNLLLNGDFNVNSQKLKKYTGNGYCLDMWYNSGLDITVLDDGWLRLENKDLIEHDIRQMFKLSRNSTYTFVSEVRGLTGRATFKASGSVLKLATNGTNFKTFNLDSKSIGIELGANSKLELRYIDLFEGRKAYNHIVEDDSIASLRCMRKFQKYGTDNYNPAFLIQTYTTKGQTNGRFRFPVRFDSVPTVTVQKFNCNEYNGNSVGNPKIKVNVVREDFVEFAITHDSTYSVSPKYVYVWFEASTQPLP